MPSGRWFSTISLALLALVLSALTASAQVISGNAYTVGGLAVDVTAADAIQAREQAIREAQRRALRQLSDQMVPAEDRAKLPPVDDARLAGMVRGVEFAGERTTSNRYIATLTVVFSADPVKTWLGEAGVKPSETVARPALIVPLWKGRNGVEPLDDRNMWRGAWTNLNTSGSAVPVAVMRGDQIDQNVMTAEEAFVGDISALSRLNERYRAPTIIVAIVEGDKNTGRLTVSGIRYETQTGARADIARTEVQDSDGLNDAAKRMHARLEEDWRNVATVRRDSENTLVVFVPIRGLPDWVQVRQRLGGIPAVKRMTVRTLEAERAEVQLEFFGTPEQLQQTLMQGGLLLAKDAGEWRLQAR
jgi:hypothetical protein